VADSTTACSKDVAIVNASGLHARSAAAIARLARLARSRVWVRKEKETADAKDVMDVLSLACEKGAVITLAVEDPSDREILNRLVRLVQDGFGE